MTENRRIVLSLLFLVVAGVGIRMGNFVHTFLVIDGQVVFTGFDPYYHMIRIFRTLADWPFVPLHDPLLNYPEGAEIMWPPLFDLMVATCALLLGYGADDVFAVEIIAAFASPVFGALTVIPLYLLGKEIFNDRQVALLASTFLLVIPAHGWYSLLGFADHHSAVTFTQVLMYYLFLKAVKSVALGASQKQRIMWLAAATTTMAAGMLIWNGFIFYVALLDLFLLIILLLDARKPDTGYPTLLWGSNIPVAIILTPFAIATIPYSGDPFSGVHLSWFHVGAIGGAGLFGLVYQGFYSEPAEQFSIKARASALCVIIAAVFLLVPMEVWEKTLAIGFHWLSASDLFMSQVGESASIFSARDGDPLTIATMAMTCFFLVVPVMLGVYLWTASKENRWESHKRLFFILWGTILFLMTLKQRRFAESFAPAQSLMMAYFLSLIYMQAQGTRFLGKFTATQAKIAAMSTILLITVAGFYTPLRPLFNLEKMTAFHLSDPVEVRMTRQLSAFRKLVLHREHIPGAPSIVEFGAINPWGIGHRIYYLTGMPVVSNNFGTYMRVQSYLDWCNAFAAEEQAATYAILERRRIRYLVVDGNIQSWLAAIDGAGKNIDEYITAIDDHGQQRYLYRQTLARTMLYRLEKKDGAEQEYTHKESGSPPIPAVTRLRLVYEPPFPWPSEEIKVYEFVKGAILDVSAAPGEKVTAMYQFKSNAGRTVNYTQSGVADMSGIARLTLPYPSDLPERRFTGSYHVTGEFGGGIQVVVPESIIQAGSRIKASVTK